MSRLPIVTKKTVVPLLEEVATADYRLYAEDILTRLEANDDCLPGFIRDWAKQQGSPWPALYLPVFTYRALELAGDLPTVSGESMRILLEEMSSSRNNSQGKDIFARMCKDNLFLLGLIWDHAGVLAHDKFTPAARFIAYGSMLVYRALEIEAELR